MGHLVRSGVDAWSDGATPPAAKALTTSMVAGTAFDTEEADELWLSMVTGGTAATSVDWELHWSDDGGTTYHKLCAINSVVGGQVDHDDLEGVGPGANGNHSYGPVAIPSGVKMQMYAARTGGAADSDLLAKATLITH